MDPLWSKRNWAKWWVSCFLPDAIEPRCCVTVVLLNPDTVTMKIPSQQSVSGQLVYG